VSDKRESKGGMPQSHRPSRGPVAGISEEQPPEDNLNPLAHKNP